MEFTARGTVMVREKDVVAEVEGNYYPISKRDCRKIVEIRQAQGYKELKEALHGSEFNFKIMRGVNKALLVLPPAKPVKNDEDADADKLYTWLLSSRAVSNNQLPNEI